MSKLSNNLMAHKTGKMGQVLPPINFTKFDSKLSTADTISDYYKEYSIECKLLATIMVREESELSLAVDNAKRAILEEIFGEFRRDMYDLSYQLEKYDVTKAKEILKRIEKNMFDY